MKNIKFFSFVTLASLLLPGCLKKKIKNPDKEQTNKLSIDNNENESIDFKRNTMQSHAENEDSSISRKSIFDENNEEDDEIIVEKHFANNSLYNAEGGKPIHENEECIATKNMGIVHFDFDVYQYIRKNEVGFLDAIIKKINILVQDKKDIKVMSRGHACNSAGSEKYNMQLSDRRAHAIKQYIIKNTNIDQDNISAFGLGSTELLVTGNKDEQAPNRRAEIFITC